MVKSDRFGDHRYVHGNSVPLPNGSAPREGGVGVVASRWPRPLWDRPAQRPRTLGWAERLHRRHPTVAPDLVIVGHRGQVRARPAAAGPPGVWRDRPHRLEAAVAGVRLAPVAHWGFARPWGFLLLPISPSPLSRCRVTMPSLNRLERRLLRCQIAMGSTGQVRRGHSRATAAHLPSHLRPGC